MDLLSFLVAVLPVFVIGFYIYKRDKEKESSMLLFKLFVYGIFLAIPVVFVELILESFFPEIEVMDFFQLLIYVFIVIALVEELFKWFFVYIGSYNHDEFDSSYDMIVYAVFVSLGFACFENILYVYKYGIFTGILRGLLSVPGHACDGILMGIYLGLAKLSDIRNNDNLSKKYKLLSIVIPVITHGIYDFCLFWGSSLFMSIFVSFVVILDIVCLMKVKEISTNNLKFKKDLFYEYNNKVNS